MGATKQVIFKVGKEEYGFDILLVSAIESYNGVVPIPNAPSFVLGILNLRGDVIPVFSLRKKFGQPEIEADLNTQLIIAKFQDMLVGFKVDSVSEIEEIEESMINDVPQIVRNEATRYAKCVANVKGRMIILIDHEGILSNEEEDAIGSVLKDHQ